jgi:hypothetical protein
VFFFDTNLDFLSSWPDEFLVSTNGRRLDTTIMGLDTWRGILYKQMEGGWKT